MTICFMFFFCFTHFIIFYLNVLTDYTSTIPPPQNTPEMFDKSVWL